MGNTLIQREFLGMDIDFSRVFSPTNWAERILEILTYSAIAFLIAIILLKIEKRFFAKKIPDTAFCRPYPVFLSGGDSAARFTLVC